MTYIRGQHPTDPCLETVPQGWKQRLAEPCRDNRHEHLSPGYSKRYAWLTTENKNRVDVYSQGHSLTQT